MVGGIWGREVMAGEHTGERTPRMAVSMGGVGRGCPQGWEGGRGREGVDAG